MPAPKDPIKYKKWKEGVGKGMRGKTHSLATKLKMKLAQKGKISLRKGLIYEEIFGVEKAREIKKNQSRVQKGRIISEITRNKMSEARIGKATWNKGLIKEMDARLNYERPTKFKKGQVSIFKGKYHTKEAKEKNRQAHLGKHYSPETEFKKGCTPWIKNKKGYFKHTEEWKEEARKRFSGKNNPNWADGKSFEPYTREFNRQLKELIRQRDNYQCQKCGCPEIENIEKLSVHHIDYNKKNCLPSNLIALCKRCNCEVNFNREYWTKYFQKDLIIRLAINKGE